MRRSRLTSVIVCSLVIVTLCGVGSDASAGRTQTVARTSSLALGGEHACALTDDAGVRCWGQNRDGQLADSQGTSRSVAIDVEGLHTPVAQITAGYNYTCARANAGTVQCWGSNTNGQLGAATTGRCEKFACSRVPVDVIGLNDVASIAAGYGHSCAITASGQLTCWGFNLYGQLGDGTTTDRISPGEVSGISGGVAAVAPGDVQTCALMNDGTVRCWGNNLLGELGDGTRVTSLTPVTVCRDTSCSQPLSDIVQLSAGDYHTCALNTLGDVYCWGSNLSGQLGVPGPSVATTRFPVVSGC